MALPAIALIASRAAAMLGRSTMARFTANALARRGSVQARQGALQLDTKPFINFCRDFAKTIDVGMGRVIETETKAALQTAARRVLRSTKARSGGKYNPSSKFFKGWVRMDGKFHYVGPSEGGRKGSVYSDAKWMRLMQRLQMNRKRAETRVALSKAVFYRVAKELKLFQYGSGWDEPSELKRALEKSGGMGSAAQYGPIWGTRKVVHTYKNLRSKNPTLNFYIDSTNTFNPTTKGAGKLQAALNGRGRYFEESVKRGCMKNAENAARAYPGIFVTG